MNGQETRRERFILYAEQLRARFNKGILKNMQEKPLWSLYKLEQDARGNTHKRPYSPKGYAISIYKPCFWSSLDNVLEALASGKFDFAGIGFMLPAPYVLLDKDASENAPLYDREKRKIVSPLALRLLEQVPSPSYAELSPNNGLYIITEGKPKRGNFKTEQLEMYTNWFSTVTTRHIPGTLIVVTIFLTSPLGQREKAQDEEGYGRRGNTNYVDRTIDRILEKRRNPPQRRQPVISC